MRFWMRKEKRAVGPPVPRVILGGRTYEGHNLTPAELAPFHEGFIDNMGASETDPRAQKVAFDFYQALGLPLSPLQRYRQAILRVVQLLVKDQMAINSDGVSPSVWRNELLARDPGFAYNLDALAASGEPTSLTDSDQERT